MKVISVDDVKGTEREVQCPHGGFTSFRLLLARDGMGFSMSRTVIPPGEPQHWHYKHHLEACYCVTGIGTLRSDATGEEWTIAPGTLYVLDQHDGHTFQAHATTVLLCVFNPPITGGEVHAADGSYPSASTR